MSVTATQIEQALRDEIAPLDSLQVINESHLHAGHAGAGEGSHWRVRFTSPCCAGLARVARHRLVYDALRSVIPLGIHALAIEARAPDER
ncbi:MAG: BolA family transcriptional regulator [Ideonella sp.]|nr:BolA family transcriptional regulator [Ideonella sp.]MBL0149054.1 BolA family transcriptional regulator [Ideonella sp.]